MFIKIFHNLALFRPFSALLNLGHGDMLLKTMNTGRLSSKIGNKVSVRPLLKIYDPVCDIRELSFLH